MFKFNSSPGFLTAGLVAVLALFAALGCSDNFFITILVSDHVADTDGGVNSDYSITTSTVTDTQVTAPEYTLSLGTLTLKVDAGNIVTDETSGFVGLSLVSEDQDGESYVMSAHESLGATFYEIDQAYLGGTEVTLGESIPASAFTLVGKHLPVTRNVIISHIEAGVAAYEVIRITFLQHH